MLIAIDVGNSSINIGYFIGDVLTVQSLPSHPLISPDAYVVEIEGFLERNRVEKRRAGCIISSVVTGHAPVMASAARRLSCCQVDEVLTVAHDMRMGIVLDVRNPHEFGSDRIACAAGAYQLYKEAVAVVDFGTATTITVVDSAGSCRGGAILPGLRLMNGALGRETSKLSAVALDPPGGALGTDTAGCIRSGLFYGTAGAVERIVSEIETEIACGCRLVITGGHGEALSAFLRRQHDTRPTLVLEGLKFLYDFNRHS